MIEFISRAYKVNEAIFDTLEAAQVAALTEILSTACGLTAEAAAQALVEDTKKVIDVLSTTKSSRPKGRKINGGKKRRVEAPALDLPFNGAA